MKFKITADDEKYTREIGGVHFVAGVAETDKESVARWLEGRGGFTVEAQVPKKKENIKANLEQQKAESKE